MAKLTSLARPGKEYTAIGAGAELSGEAVQDTEIPHSGHPGGCQLHEPLEGCSGVLLSERSRGGDGVSLGPTESSGGKWRSSPELR